MQQILRLFFFCGNILKYMHFPLNWILGYKLLQTHKFAQLQNLYECHASDVNRCRTSSRTRNDLSTLSSRSKASLASVFIHFETLSSLRWNTLPVFYSPFDSFFLSPFGLLILYLIILGRLAYLCTPGNCKRKHFAMHAPNSCCGLSTSGFPYMDFIWDESHFWSVKQTIWPQPA